jgi:hypothetical protein
MKPRGRGIFALVFPILYISVPQLDAAQKSHDAVISIVEERQYVDWRPIRHHDVNSPEVKQIVEQFCTVIAKKLRAPWISSEERRAIEEQKRAEDERRSQELEAKRRADEKERHRAAEAKRRAEEERVRREAERAEQRRGEKEERDRREQQARELQARGKTDKERKRTEERRGEKSFITEARREPGEEHGVGAPLWKIISFPWHPVETIRQAMLLTLIAVICFVAIALFGAVAQMPPYYLLGLHATVWTWIFVFFACCSLGTYFNSRMAALLGFAGVLLPFIALLCFFVVSPSPGDGKWTMLATLVVLFFLSWLTFDGIRGTWAISRLRGAAGKES